MAKIDGMLVERFANFVGVGGSNHHAFHERDRRMWMNRSLMVEDILGFSYVKDAGANEATCYRNGDKSYGGEEVGKVRITRDGAALWIPETDEAGKHIMTDFPHGIAGMSLLAIGVANLATERIPNLPVI